MYKAYDTLLQTEVSADIAACDGSFEHYRYECAHCGEEVFVAASHSARISTHFRHRSGNSDVECEKYLGCYGILNIESNSRQSNRERIEFYYGNTNKTFSIGIRFSEKEILEYEKQDAKMEISTQSSEEPFYDLPITTQYFVPDVPTPISLNSFSFSYSISNTLDGLKRKYDFFKHGNTPIFFKIQGTDNNFRSKLVRGETLYTKVSYFIAFQNQYSTTSDIRLHSEIQVSETFQFETMERKFFGKVLSIEKKTANIDELLKSWGYQLETSETLTLLWPPAPVIDDVSVIASNDVFVFTSFELQAHENINVHSRDVLRVNQGISRISVDSKIKIFKKNAEIVIKKADPYSEDYNINSQSESTANVFSVPDGDSYFLFNRSGVIPLAHGQVVFMTPNNVIKRYASTYCIGHIYPQQQRDLAGEELLEDIRLHYKRTETFCLESFALIALSETASQYIDECKSSRIINSVAKQYILEGLL